jgi:putative intracellular protease/amidase
MESKLGSLKSKINRRTLFQLSTVAGSSLLFYNNWSTARAEGKVSSTPKSKDPKMKRIVFVIANPAKSELTGWPIGYWLSELAHPYWEFMQQKYEITLASPKGGAVTHDGISDPENAKGNPNDFVSLGFKSSKTIAPLLSNTKPISEIRAQDFDAIFLVGGLSPMYTFIDNTELHKLFVSFYESNKVSAAVCHGTCVLLKAKLSNGKLLADGKKWTGFSNAEEDIVDKGAGKKVEPFRIQDEAGKISSTTFVAAPPFSPHAIRDGHLITGQQGNSGGAAAKLVIEALG